MICETGTLLPLLVCLWLVSLCPTGLKVRPLWKPKPCPIPDPIIVFGGLLRASAPIEAPRAPPKKFFELLETTSANEFVLASGST